MIDRDRRHTATKHAGRPQQILPPLRAGDRLYPNYADYNAMANAIDVKLFSVRQRFAGR